MPRLVSLGAVLVAVVLTLIGAMSAATALSLGETAPRLVREQVDRAALVRLHVACANRVRGVRELRVLRVEPATRDLGGHPDGERLPESAASSTERAMKMMSRLPMEWQPRNVELAVRDAIEDLQLDDDDLLALLADHCDIQPSDIPDGVPVLDHAACVARVGARGVATEEDFYDENFESHFPVAVEFGVATTELNSAVSPAKEFSPATRKIFATFVSESVLAKKVLVKWTHVERNTIHIYGKYAVEPRADHNYVWLELPGNWPSGVYAVEVYAMSRGLPPIAGGRYLIR